MATSPGRNIGAHTSNTAAAPDNDIDLDTACTRALALRNERRFLKLLEFTERMIENLGPSPMLLRLHGHALIELGRIDHALSVLSDILQYVVVEHPEYSQAIGLIGRAHKQNFLNDASGGQSAYARSSLRAALSCYADGYDRALSTGNADIIWHGVNVAALAKRAEWLGVSPPRPIDWRNVAQQLIAEIAASDGKGAASAWDYATAGEACLALDDPIGATHWFTKYANAVKQGEYALHSTLRQLEQLWRIKADQSPVGKVFSMLQARLVCVEGGVLQISSGKSGEIPAASEHGKVALEGVIGPGGFEFYDSFVTGLGRGKSVARIGPSRHKGTGTGFLVNGGDFHRRLRGQRLLLTNAHVVTDDRSVPGQEDALRPQEAKVVFTRAHSGTVHKVAKLLWTSDCLDLDASLLALDPPPPTDIPVLKLAETLPPRPKAGSNAALVYILGHPGGGDLSISLHNNSIIDHDGPESGSFDKQRVRIHYRTPTLPGSSGSPVFYGEDWLVIGLHHGHGTQLQAFDKRGETYEGNEAIWIRSICARTRGRMWL